jgi:hypothetical protein
LIVSLSDSLVGFLLAIPNVRLRVALSMQGVSHESLGPPFSESKEIAMQTNGNAQRDLDTLTALNLDFFASVQKGDVKRFEEIWPTTHDVDSGGPGPLGDIGLLVNKYL